MDKELRDHKVESKIRELWSYVGKGENSEKIVIIFTICLMLYGYKNSYYNQVVDSMPKQIEEILSKTNLSKKIFITTFINTKKNDKYYLIFNENITKEEADYAIQGDAYENTSRKLGNVLGMQCSGDSRNRIKMFINNQDITYYGFGIFLITPEVKVQIYAEICMTIDDTKKDFFIKKARNFLKVAQLLNPNYKIHYYIDNIHVKNRIETRQRNIDITI